MLLLKEVAHETLDKLERQLMLAATNASMLSWFYYFRERLSKWGLNNLGSPC